MNNLDVSVDEVFNAGMRNNTSQQNPISQGVEAFNNSYKSASTMFSMFNSGDSPRRMDYNQMNQMQPNINNYYNGYNQPQMNAQRPMSYDYGYTENNNGYNGYNGYASYYNQPKQVGYYGFTNPDYGR